MRWTRCDSGCSLAGRFVLAQPISVALARFATLVRASSQSSATGSFLLFALLVPWTALLILVEPGRSDRFWWLWPLLVVFLAALVFHVVGTTTVRRRIVAAGLGTLLLALSSVNPSSAARLQSWYTHGWSGVDTDHIRAVDYIASRVAGPRQPQVGYHLPFFHGITTLSSADARFKVGAQFDLVFAQKHGIVNATRCPEGFGPDDDYRLADDPSRPLPTGNYRVVGAPDAGFRLARRFGSTRVFERVTPAGQ